MPPVTSGSMPPTGPIPMKGKPLLPVPKPAKRGAKPSNARSGPKGNMKGSKKG